MRGIRVQTGRTKHRARAHSPYPERLDRFAPAVFKTDAPRHVGLPRQPVSVVLFRSDECGIVVLRAKLRYEIAIGLRAVDMNRVERAAREHAGIHGTQHRADTKIVAAQCSDNGDKGKGIANRVQTDEEHRWRTRDGAVVR